MSCRFSLNLPLFGLGPSSKDLGTNLKLSTNKIVWIHWSLDLEPLSKVTLNWVWTRPFFFFSFLHQCVGGEITQRVYSHVVKTEKCCPNFFCGNCHYNLRVIGRFNQCLHSSIWHQCHKLNLAISFWLYITKLSKKTTKHWEWPELKLLEVLTREWSTYSRVVWQQQQQWHAKLFLNIFINLTRHHFIF